MKKKQKRIDTAFRIEIALAFLIAVCVVILIGVHEQRENAIDERYLETLLISTEHLEINDSELKELIIEYRPRPYKMIEIYDDKFDLTFRIQFRGELINMSDPITNHLDLIDYFRSHREGHTNYTIGNDEVDVYFKWCKVEGRNEDQLVIIYTSRVQESADWMHNTICYVILILAFMIIIMSMLSKGHTQVHQYRHNQNNIYDSMSR